MSQAEMLNRTSPVMWAMIGIPLATVVASAVTLFLAIDGAEPELPAQYAWEGKALDADLALGEAAHRAGVSVELTLAKTGRIEARLDVAASAPDSSNRSLPSTLRLRLTHATLPQLDRDLTLAATGSPGVFALDAAPIPAGHWLVQIDHADEWRIRGRIHAPAARVTLGL